MYTRLSDIWKRGDSEGGGSRKDWRIRTLQGETFSRAWSRAHDCVPAFPSPFLYKSSSNILQEIRKTSKGKSQGVALAEEKGLEAFQGLVLCAREQKDTNETSR